jgi:hypothetical protein
MSLNDQRPAILTARPKALTERLPVVFTAQSKAYFYCRDAVCQFVLSKGAVPLNPFRVFEYFLGDRVERDLVRQGNNNLIRIAEELWVFGETIADGVLAEIFLAKTLDKTIRYFTIHNQAEKIREVSPKDLKFERTVYATTKLKHHELLTRILGHDPDKPLPQQLLFTELSEEQ